MSSLNFEIWRIVGDKFSSGRNAVREDVDNFFVACLLIFNDCVLIDEACWSMWTLFCAEQNPH